MRPGKSLFTFAVLATAAAGAYLARADLASRAGSLWLERRFNVSAELEFTDVALESARIRRLKLGPAGGLEATGIQIRYNWRELVAGRVKAILVEEVTASIAIDESGSVKSELLDAIMGRGDSGQGAPLPPRIEVDRGTLKIASPKGGFLAEGGFSLAEGRLESAGLLSDEDGFSAGRWQVSADGVPDAIVVSGRISARFDWRSAIWDLAGTLRPLSGALDVEASFAGLDPTGIDLGLKAPVNARLAIRAMRFPGLGEPINGAISAGFLPGGDRAAITDIALDLAGGVTPDMVLSARGSADLPMSSDGKASADLMMTGSASGIEHLGWSAGAIRYSMPLSLTLDKQLITLTLAGDGTMTAAAILADGRDLWPGDATIALPAQSDALAFDRSTGEWALNARALAKLEAPGTVALPEGWRADNPALELPVIVTSDRSRISVALGAPGTVRAARVEGPGNDARIEGFKATIDAGPGFASLDPTTGALSVSLTPRLEARRIVLGGERVEPAGVRARIEIEGDGGAIRWSMKGGASSIALPERGWTSRKLDVSATGTETGIDFQAALEGLKVMPDLSNANLRAKGRLVSGRLEATLTAATAGPASREVGRARITADLAGQRALADIMLGPLSFAPGGLQPSAFAPRLRRVVHDIAGSVTLKGSIDWRGGGLDTSLALALEGLSGIAGPITFVNLNGVIDIDRLWPISTAPDQVIAIEQVVTGLPMQAVLLRFELDGSEIEVAEGRLGLIGGSAALEPGRFSFTRPGQRLFLKVHALSLAEFFALAGIDGLSGDGAISGRVPVTLFPDGIIIADAALSADRPGILRYDRAKAPAALSGAGDSMELALSALSDFHYEKLIVRLDRKLTGEAVLALHIAGANPSFYEGYPVEFNLTLTGKLDEVIRKGLAGYQLPSIIERRLNEIQQ